MKEGCDTCPQQNQKHIRRATASIFSLCPKGEREKKMESTENKRVCVKVENDAVCTTGGRWDELSPEILASIFVRIVPPELMVRSVSLVCRNWMETVAGPYCWTEIDLEEWCRRCCIANRSHLIDPVVRKIVRQSRSTFRRLSTYRLGDVGFSFAASRYGSSYCFFLPILSQIHTNLLRVFSSREHICIYTCGAWLNLFAKLAVVEQDFQ